MKEQPSPSVVLNRIDLHTDTSHLVTSNQSPRTFSTTLITKTASTTPTSQAGTNQQKHTHKYTANSAHATPISSKLSKSDGMVANSSGGTTTAGYINGLNLTDSSNTSSVSGSGGRLSALRNWLKQSRWRKKDKQTPPTTPQQRTNKPGTESPVYNNDEINGK
jgi:hypothetical protein